MKRLLRWWRDRGKRAEAKRLRDELKRWGHPYPNLATFIETHREEIDARRDALRKGRGHAPH